MSVDGNFSSPRQQQGRSDTEQCEQTSTIVCVLALFNECMVGDDMSPEIKDYKPLDYLMKTLQARR